MIESLGHYRVLDKIGAGGLGDLYRARDTRVGRTVALRVVSPAISGDSTALDRFLRDAKTAAAVSHPNIAALYEVAEENGTHYLACEYVPGQSLKTLISGRPLNPRRAIDLAIQIADALSDAYASDIVHGDLRAEGIVVNAKGNAKLLDFGLSAWSRRARPRDAVDHQADIAALGTLLHEMITGALPAAGQTSALGLRLPEELDAILQKARRVQAAEQYEAAAILAAELRTVYAQLDERAQASSALAPTAAKGTRARKTLVWLIVVALVGALGWLVWSVSRMR